MTALVVAAAQVAPGRGGVDTSTLEDAVRRAAAAGARLVVLPELAVTGWAFTTMSAEVAAQQTLDGPTVRRLRELSAELDVVVVCGIAERDGTTWWNSAVVVQRGELLGSYRKVHLWDREKQWFACSGPGASTAPLVLDTDVGRLAVMVCYDLEFPEWVRMAAEQGAEVVAAPVNWPRLHRPGQRPVEVAKAQAVAAAYGVHVVVADRHQREDGTDWEGASLVCGADGYLLAGPATEPDDLAGPALLLAGIDPAAARDKQRGPRNDVVADRRPDLYR